MKMGRDAAKAAGNPYYEARMEAARTINSRFGSREGASMLLNIGSDSLANYESGLCKVVPPESVLAMATGYRAPELVNWYCAHECPLGGQVVCPDKTRSLEQIALEMVHTLGRISEIKDTLVEITYDGIISEQEQPQLHEILTYLREIEASTVELRLWCSKYVTSMLTRVG